MKKNVFDKDTVNKQLVLLSDYLENQRSAKITLLSYLEKVSAYISNVNSTEGTESLVSCLNNVQDIFDNIKNNIDKLIELKLFIENISNSSSLNVIDFEKYNNQIIELEEKIKTTNTSYNTFMDTLTSISLIDFGELTYKKMEPNINSKIDENVPPTQVVLEGIHSLEAFEKMLENIETESTVSIVEELQTNSTVENSENSSVEEDFTESPNEDIQVDINTALVTDTPSTTEESISETTTETIENKETISTTDIEESTNKTIENDNNEEPSLGETYDTEEASIQKSIETKLLEKTLFIDYESNIAVLPYSIFDLEAVFSDNPENYSSINDIIEKEYTVSLDDYTNNSISRFKQTFRLAKEKSKLSFFESLSYANKLLFESEVEPIIIAACESVHELDCYLECLNNDTISSFNCFKIIDN